nr:HAD hydrolase-like protein [Allobaculum sp. Allo2]
MTRDEMRKTRFVHLFKAFGLERTVPEGFEETFHHQLYEGNHPMPKALEGLEALKTAGLPLFIVTNGKQSGQYKRLKAAGMDTLFTEIYTSDEFGVSKPDLSYFQKCTPAPARRLARRCCQMKFWSSAIRGKRTFSVRSPLARRPYGFASTASTIRSKRESSDGLRNP